MRPFIFCSLLFLGFSLGLLHASDPENQVCIPDTGWQLWPDTQAAWQKDALYLPEEANLTKLPVNPPTGGWDVLKKNPGITVTLPATVEQYYWGKFGTHPYTHDEYVYAGNDPAVQNGNYAGVSWWWKELEVPASFQGKHAILTIRGARQRTEVYVNQKLVGYDLIAETSFSCDIKSALIPGQKNQIALRITNPGGRMDWVDTSTIAWGTYVFQRSHGFGGLDRGLTLTAHPEVYLEDSWVLNTPELRIITAHVTLKNTTEHTRKGILLFTIIDPASGQTVERDSVSAVVGPETSTDFSDPLTYAQAKLWNVSTPNLYQLKSTWTDANKQMDEAERTFGFRWFEPRGIGAAAGLYLNEQRIRLYTAISWGFWGLNGLWPTPALAEKEVRAAKTLGMNCLNFHRDIGKEEVLADQDRIGLLRYMEPGGGVTALDGTLKRGEMRPKGRIVTSGDNGEATTFTQKYEETKILRMIRQFRSHPSLVIYMIQNEIEPKLKSPRVFNLLRKMHELDPSRVIATKSGISPNNQAWMAPYHETIHVDDGTSVSGWRDEHTVGGPGVWVDSLYQDPTHFTHRTEDRAEVIDWGEMLGSATADHHGLMVQQILAQGGQSYDLQDHQQIDEAYNQFLDKWNFRSAFPTTESLYQEIGNKEYEFWGRVIETARLCESNDILTMSGWESTAIENHSGLVDNLRNFKGDPALLAPKLAPLLPVVKPRSVNQVLGGTTLLDVYLLNETGHAAPGQLHLTLTDPQGRTNELKSWPAPAYVANQFVYPVEMTVPSPVLNQEGVYRWTLRLDGAASATNSDTIRVIAPQAGDYPATRVALLGQDDEVLKQLHALPYLQVTPYDPKGSYDLFVAPHQPTGHVFCKNDGSKILNTTNETLYRTALQGGPDTLALHFEGLPHGPIQVSLYFCELGNKIKGQRVFDLDLNGQTVLKNFDIIAEAGGLNTAVVKTVTVPAPDGILEIRPSHLLHDDQDATLNAVKIVAGSTTVAVTCGGEKQTDPEGQVWLPYRSETKLTPAVLAQVKAGLPLLVLAGDSASAEAPLRALDGAGAFHFSGTIGTARAPWMGDWIFVRDHPIFQGLPVNQVMKGDYQVPVRNCYGVLVDGPQVQIVAGYSRDHDRQIGAAIFTSQLGQGRVIFQSISEMQAAAQTRLLSNEVRYLEEK